MNTPTTGEIRPKSADKPQAAATDLGRVNLDILPDSHLLTTEEAAAILCVKPATLRLWRCVGRYNLPYVKAGIFPKYKAGDLREFIARRTQTHTGQNGGAE